MRDDLSAWQLGLAPRAEVVLRRSRLDLLRELIGMFPVWVRGAALAGAAAAMLLVTLSIAGTRISLKDGDFAINFGRTGNSATGAPAVSSEEIERMVQNAVAGEREEMEQRYSAQLASLKDQLNADHQARIAGRQGRESGAAQGPSGGNATGDAEVQSAKHLDPFVLCKR